MAAAKGSMTEIDNLYSTIARALPATDKESYTMALRTHTHAVQYTSAQCRDASMMYARG